MKRILVITNECYTDESANAFCIEKIIECIAKFDVQVDILSISSKEQEIRISNNIHVFSIKKWGFKTSLIGRLFTRIVRKICYEFYCPDINILSLRQYLLKVKELLRSFEYDAVLAASGGFFAQIVLCKIRGFVDQKTVSLFFDPPVSINFLYNRQKIYYKKMLSYEKEIFSKNSYILLEDNLFKAMGRHDERYIQVGIPLITKKDIRNYVDNTVVFVGTLWNDIRNPEYIIKLLENIPELKVRFYGNLQTKSVLESLGKRELYYGMLKYDKVDEILKNAKYLLNISNTNSVQTPSKIFEYISYGKPIINVIKNSDDKTVELIRKYGNGISLLEGEENNMQKLKNFLDKEYIQLPYDDIERKFIINTPRETAKKILEIF